MVHLSFNDLEDLMKYGNGPDYSMSLRPHGGWKVKPLIRLTWVLNLAQPCSGCVILVD